MAETEVSEKTAKLTRRGRLLTAGIAGGALVIASVGAVSLAMALGMGERAPAEERASAANVQSNNGMQLPVAVSPFRPKPAPTSTPLPLSPGEAAVAAGGDQPGQALPPVYGNIAESANASPEFLALRDALEGEIVAYAEAVGGIDVAIAVTDLQTGETISVAGNAPHYTGCTINMFALFAAVSAFQAGAASPGSVAYNIRRGVGDSYPPEVKNFLQKIFGSYLTGTQHARDLMASWGMTASYFDHVPYYGGENAAPNVLTALETNDILTRLWRGQLFNPEWTAYTINRLREISWFVNYIIPGRLPPQATVAHKIGYYAEYDGWVNNDTGIVMFTGADGQEKAYVITYLSQEAGTEYTGYSFGARLSRIVWDHFANEYGTPPPPPPPPPPEPTLPPPTPSPTPEPPTPTPSPSPTGTPAPD